jgi:putative ABC transport system ATP-binding protein
MHRFEFGPTLKRINLNKKYFLFSIFYGLSTLIIPLGVQFLVNNLALAGIWLNTITFLIIICIGLILTQMLRYSQVVITEFMQREIFIREMGHWQSAQLSEKSYYYFEIIKLMKSYSMAFTNLVEMALVIGFGLFTILLFHPAFITLPLIIVLLIYLIYRDSGPAVDTSIEESNRKYDIFYKISDNLVIKDAEIDKYLSARSKHFKYIKRSTVLMALANILCQLLLLGVGIYFIQTNQLSVGQLVSAEIILSGIMASLIKLPKTMEDLYDFETSKFKIARALEGKKRE